MIYAIVVVLVLIADQGMKYYTVSNIALNTGEVPLIDGLVHLAHVHNYGAAFSIMQNTRWLLVALTAVFIAVVIYALCAEYIQGPLGRWSAVLVLAGALGNGIDRLFIGYVVDMIEVEFMSFPVFNIADIFVTCAGIAFCFYIVFHKSPEPETAAEKVPFSQRVRALREKEPERHGGDIEMIRRGARGAEIVKKNADVPPAEPKVRPEVPKFDPNDPFAEWEKPAQKAEPVVFEEPAPQPEPEYIPEPAPVAEPVVAPEPVAVPAREPEVVTVDDMEFNIDDILAEFK